MKYSIVNEYAIWKKEFNELIQCGLNPQQALLVALSKWELITNKNYHENDLSIIQIRKNDYSK